MLCRKHNKCHSESAAGGRRISILLRKRDSSLRCAPFRMTGVFSDSCRMTTFAGFLQNNSEINFVFRLCIFWFSLMLFCDLASFAGGEASSDLLDPANFLINTPEKKPEDSNTAGVPQKKTESPTIRDKQPQPAPEASKTADNAGESRAQLLHKLWLAEIGVPKGENNSKNAEELQQVIRRLHSAGTEPKKQPAASATAAAATAKAEPNQTTQILPAKESPEIAETEKAVTKPSFETIREETLQKFNSLSQHPEQINNPLELGEVLFLSGHLKEAAIAYQEALNRMQAGDSNSAHDRAWLLFQTGTCLRNDDPATAAKMYKQLIEEYPNSPWTEFAKAQDKLIEWYQKDTPEKLVGSK